jgi:hypothetical protein
MAEAVKQFFVGFIHPRTWLAAIIALIVAAVAGLAIAGTLADQIGSLLSLSSTEVAQLKSIALGLFLTVLFTYSGLVTIGTATPLILVIVSGLVAGIVFGALSKKERIASKSIVGGLNIAFIYIIIVVVATIVWLVGFSGFGALYSSIVALLQGAPYDVLLTFIVVWWVTAIVSMLVLSVKHD